MAESVQAEKVPGNNGIREESELLVPLEESDFKPRLYKNICQYCGYTSGLKTDVDRHINSQHEMKIWYKCKYCKYASVEGHVMKLHIKRNHKYLFNSDEIKDLIIDDPKEIRCLKKSQIEKRRLHRKVGPSNFMPIEEKDFKPREHPYSCQYCDFKHPKNRKIVDNHVNYVHEMTRWYQCSDCKYASLAKQDLRMHIITHHKQYPDNSSLEGFLIKDEKIVEHLKHMRIKKKIQKSKTNSMLSPKDYSRNFVPIDKADFKPRTNPKKLSLL